MKWMRRTAAGGLAAAAISACSGQFAVLPASDVGDAPFAECAAPYVFAGETTLATLGLGDLASPREANRVGTIWITRDPITREEFGAPGAPAFGPDGQVLCVEWADGSGMSMTMAEPWAPEISAGSDETPAPGYGALAPLGILLAIVAVTVISYLAFRGDRASPG